MQYKSIYVQFGDGRFLLGKFFVKNGSLFGRLNIHVFAQNRNAALINAVHRRTVAAGCVAAHESTEGWFIAWFHRQEIMTDSHRLIPLICIKKHYCQPITTLKIELPQAIPQGGGPGFRAVLTQVIPLVDGMGGP